MSRSPDDEVAFRRFLLRETGFVIPEARWEFLAPRFLGRLEGRGFRDVHAYLTYLKRDPLGRTELEEIYCLLTVRKTSFFRNPASYMALTHEVLPRLARDRSTSLPISLWSAGCATGEEPYSIAMAAQATLKRSGHSPYVLATDIVREALATARIASYPERSASTVPPEFRRFLKVEGGRAWVDPEVRGLVEFAEHNLAHDPIPRSASGAWDVIFCRNVFIYFDVGLAKTVLRRFWNALAPGGILFLGHAEVFTDLESDFEVVFWGDTFYYKRKEHSVPEATFQASPDEETRKIPRELVEEAKASLTSPRSETTRTRFDHRGETPTRAVPRTFVSPRDTSSMETRAFPRTLAGRLPHEQLLQAERRRQSGDDEGAARALRAACAQAPRWAKPRLLLAKLYEDRGDHAHARRELETAAEVEPLAHRHHFLLGKFHSRRQDHGQAEVAYRHALYLEPDFLPARFELGMALKANHQFTRGCRELRSVLRSLRRLDPERVRAMASDLPVSPAELRGACEEAIDEMGGSTEDSGVWRIPPGR